MSITQISRLDLLDWLLPCCEPASASLRYPKGSKVGPGWVYGEDDVARAIEAFRNGTLAEQVFYSRTQEGLPYTIENASRLGLVAHRNGQVTIFCIDFDDHHGNGGNTRLLDPVSRFLGARPLVFTSRSGRGYHAFFRLTTPMPVDDFIRWWKAWGFNRDGRPESFPKSAKLSQFWIPNEPNEHGGDTYVQGDFRSCQLESLPAAPSQAITSTTIAFLMGEAATGQRNDALNKAAHELGRNGFSRVEAYALCELGARLCGLEHDETLRTFESGYHSGKAAEPRPSKGLSEAKTSWPLTGFGNGERFTAAWKADARYCFALGRWFVWDNRRWSSRQDGAVHRMAKDAIRAIELEKAEALARASEKSQARVAAEYDGHIRRSSTLHGLNETLSLAASEPGMSIGLDQLDHDQMVLNVANGTIDLTTGLLRPHRREDFQSMLCPVDYEPDAVCPRWDQCLLEIFAGDEEMVEFLQRAVGYAMTGLTNEQCLFFLFGDGQNGKSTVINTITALFGEYAQKAPTDLIMRPERSSGGGPSPDLARLRGMRFVTTSELEEGVRLGEARIKDLTGGDRIVGRPLYKDPIEFDPTHTLFVYGNHKPRVEGTDEGIWRRIHLIHLPVHIPEDRKDPGLGHALQQELSGILAWAVRGCLEWQRAGLKVPLSVRAATREYRNESDPLRDFIEQCCDVAAVHAVSKGDLYMRYVRWCGTRDAPPMSAKALTQRLVAMGFKDGRDATERFWKGIMPKWEGGQ